MKSRDEALHVRPDGRIETTPRSRSQLRREDMQADGKRRLNIPRPTPSVSVCLYCGDEYTAVSAIDRCPKCGTPIG